MPLESTFQSTFPRTTLRRFIKTGFPLACAATALAVLSPSAQALSDLEIKLQLERFRAEKDQKTPLWQSAPLSAPTNSLGQYSTLQALVNSNHFLSSLRDWRETLRGKGAEPVRRFSLGGEKANSIALEVGARPLPMSELAGLAGGVAPSIGVTYGKISFGSTAPLRSANRALHSYDALMNPALAAPGQSLSGQPLAPVAPVGQDESQMTWFTARPVDNKTGNIELLYVRGRRDLTPTAVTGKNFVNGSFWGSRAALNLSPAWKVRTEFINSSLNSQADSASAWRTYLDGTAKLLPWGTTTVNAVYSDVDTGFASFTNPVPAEGSRVGQVALQQNVTAGKFSGSLRMVLSRSDRKDAELLVPGTAQQTNGLNVTSNLRWTMSPRIALTATQTYLATDQRFVMHSPLSSMSSAQLTGDVGVEVKLTPTIALAITTGSTQLDSASTLLNGIDQTPISLRDEGRINVSLKQTTPEGSWGVQMIRSEIADDANNQANTEAQTVLLQAERQLLPWLRLKGSMNLAGQDLTVAQVINDRMDRSIEAQLNLRKLGLLGLRYGDWDTAQSAPGALALRTSARQYGVNYTFGAAAGQPGFGFSIAYNKTAVPVADQPLWRIGLNYR